MGARDHGGVLLVVAIVAALFWLPSPWGVAAVTGAATVELAEIGLYVWYSKRGRATTGAEGLVGAIGVAVTACDPEGQVRVEGELWRATCSEGVQSGDPVVVRRVQNRLTLDVAPLHSARG
jgi:membrane-bound serine protease (ClpP class)